MRKISGIKYTVTLINTLIIAALLAPVAYSQTQLNVLTVNPAQSDKPLIRQDRGEETRMVKEEGLNTFFSIKVTTTNQKRYDGNRDGVLSGKELQMYLGHYYRR